MIDSINKILGFAEREIKNNYSKELEKKSKRVTGRTIDSIRLESTVRIDGLKLVTYANESLKFIESGRKPGSKRPIRKVGGVWRLFPDLESWKRSVNFGGSDYMLAKAIGEKGIKPTKVTPQVAALSLASITAYSLTTLGHGILSSIKDGFK